MHIVGKVWEVHEGYNIYVYLYENEHAKLIASPRQPIVFTRQFNTIDKTASMKTVTMRRKKVDIVNKLVTQTT